MERAQDIAEVKDIRDTAVTLQSYCRNAKLAKTDQDTWAEIRLRAERKAGDMLATIHAYARAENLTAC